MISRVCPSTEEYFEHRRKGYIASTCDYYNGLTVFHRTNMVEAMCEWNPYTVLGPLVVNGEGEVIARGFNKILDIKQAGFPEADPKNWPQADPVITRWYDGWLGLLGRTRSGTPVILAKTGTTEYSKWATDFYQRNHLTAKWPTDYSPVFEIIHRESERVVHYEASHLVLLGLVHLYTGYEMPYELASEWAKRNNIPMVETLEDEETGAKEPRGYILTWNLGDNEPSLKVKIANCEYVKMRIFIADTKPTKIWEALRQGSDFWQRLATDDTLPLRFRLWVAKQKNTVINDYANAKLVAKRIFDECPFDMKNGSNSKAIFDYFRHYGLSLCPALCAEWHGTSAEPHYWDAIKPKEHDDTPYLPFGV